MSKFILEIEIPQHEADYWGEADYLAERLKEIEDRVIRGAWDEGIVRDYNGNKIGYWQTTEGEN